MLLLIMITNCYLGMNSTLAHNHCFICSQKNHPIDLLSFMRLSTTVILALLVICAVATDNFQQRLIYNGRKDCVCAYGDDPSGDLIQLTILIDGQDKFEDAL